MSNEYAYKIANEKLSADLETYRKMLCEQADKIDELLKYIEKTNKKLHQLSCLIEKMVEVAEVEV